MAGSGFRLGTLSRMSFLLNHFLYWSYKKSYFVIKTTSTPVRVMYHLMESCFGTTTCYYFMFPPFSWMMTSWFKWCNYTEKNKKSHQPDLINHPVWLLASGWLTFSW